MTKDEIIDYVLNSPENTNPNVLKGMLDQLDNGGGGDFKSIEVWRGEEFEWTQGRGNDWHSPCLINFNDFSSDEYYVVKIFPYMNEPINIFKDGTSGTLTTKNNSQYVVFFKLSKGGGPEVVISSFETTPEIEVITISKIVPISYQESEWAESSSMEGVP